MKRKLISKNKKKNSTEIFKSKYKYYSLMKIIDKDKYYEKYKHRYNKVEDFNNAFIEDYDDFIWIPVYISSKNKKSRIKKIVVEYSISFDIDSFNKKYNTNKTLEDLKKYK